MGGVPIVTHLHGTELKMLDAIAREQPGVGQGPHARWWAARMGEAARRADATIAISPHQRSEAVRLLELDPATVHLLPDGVDVERFAVRRPSDDERRERWLDWLVRDPQGWDEESKLPGSIRYAQDEVMDAFFDAETGAPRPVLMFVGRFLGFKRVPLLVRAYARARARMSVPAPLVIWGGAPGEWEGEHPHTVATREGVEGVFFAGWRGHDDLPLGLALRRLLRRAVDGRAVRPRLPRGHGLRAPRDRHAQRWPAELRRRRRPASRTAGSCRPTTRKPSRRRSCKPSTIPPNASGAERTPPGTSATRIRGTASPAVSRSSTSRSRPPTRR